MFFCSCARYVVQYFYRRYFRAHRGSRMTCQCKCAACRARNTVSLTEIIAKNDDLDSPHSRNRWQPFKEKREVGHFYQGPCETFQRTNAHISFSTLIANQGKALIKSIFVGRQYRFCLHRLRTELHFRNPVLCKDS